MAQILSSGWARDDTNGWKNDVWRFMPITGIISDL